ncbi:MAG: CDP-diacylglycerol--glycerol-3-phosphate 3-phosphatidyltransferase [Candidatus Omnitrophica bacterium]|nr:CDP-diacylglycerol--glycerol-3-phosphate 3-phosphatidyltransferase [Candidatus Omnitrophota bacterium]MDD5078762.1 CDP-diacylglycerol--glycerol-3-phosphate 3-phosphatidyltransferase [Candidatus Omnitrophota bacterium]
MNIANKITMFRIALTFVFMIFLSFQGLWPKIISLLVFICAAVSDYLDGRIARKRNMSTDFGKLMDPIADKILVLAAFAAFVQMQLIKDWMFMIIVSREILITSFRLFALNKSKVLSAGKMGKHKTFSQMVIIFLILGFIVFKEVMLNVSTWNPAWEKFFRQGIDVFMWFIVGLTIYSGFSYLWDNRKVIANI